MKKTTGLLISILLTGCAQFAEMEETRKAGNVYLTGRFYEQIDELMTMAAKSPELKYSTARLVYELLPPSGSGRRWVTRTKYVKVEYPATKEEFNTWMKSVDDNFNKLKLKFKTAEEAAKRKEIERIAEAKREEEERIAEAKRKEEERIAEAKRKKATAEAAEREAKLKEEEQKARKAQDLWDEVKQNECMRTCIGNYELDIVQLQTVSSNRYVSEETKQKASKCVADLSRWKTNISNIYLNSDKCPGSKIGPVFLVEEKEGRLVVKYNDDNVILGQLLKLSEIPGNFGDGKAREITQKCLDLRNDHRNLCCESEKVINFSNAAKIAAEMPEAEKFPLLSVQPNPQMLMKDIPSGVSMKWVEAWLTANKIEHELVSKIVERQYGFTVSESDVAAAVGDMKDMTLVKGFFNDRSVFFGFFNHVLISITVVFDDRYDILLDAVVKKYSGELGDSAEVNVIRIETKDRNSELVARITSDDMGVFAWKDVFYWDSSVILNESSKAFISRALQDSTLNASEQRVKFIKIYDRKLLTYIEKRKAEKAKEAEAAKKAREAAALDF